MSDNLVGGWTDFREMDDRARQVFEQFTHDLLGVQLKPLVVRTQVVEGVNYCFLCLTKPIVPNAEEKVVELYGYEPPGQKARFDKIVEAEWKPAPIKEPV